MGYEKIPTFKAWSELNIGLDICLSILEVMHEGFGGKKYSPCPLLIEMVASGNLGVKSGVGFYDYSDGIKNKRVANQFI